MSEETKMILEQLGQIRGDIGEMKSDIRELKTDVAELKTDVAVLKTDVADLKDRVTELEEGQKNLYSLIENEVSKKIMIVGEGHFFVMKSLNELRGFQEEKEMMDLKILDLQIEIKNIKRQLKIA